MVRKSNCKRDYEIYGKFGEDDFKQYCQQVGKNFFDVTNIKMFQLADVDYITSDKIIHCVSENGIKNDPEKQGNIIFDRFYENREKNSEMIKVEVKTDTRSIESGNIVYEEHNHYQPGCAGKSMADYWYYVFVEDNIETTGELIKKQAWIINVYKLREYLDEHLYFPLQIDWSHYEHPELLEDPNYNKFDVWKLYKEYGIQTKKFIDENEKGVKKTICNLLIKIYKLKEYGIANRVF